jgi:hypothetical protein
MISRDSVSRPRVVTRGELRRIVIRRDRTCVAAKLDRTHDCQDRWGQAASPDDQRALSLDHVRDPRGRRQDDPFWCIATCYGANLAHWESANRTLCQAYLLGVAAGAGQG